MPFASKAQARKFRVMEAAGEIPRGTSSEWAHATPDIKKLPEHVSKKSSLVDKLAAATALRDRLVLVTKLAAVKAARSGKLQAARKMAKYAQALEQGSSISKAASAAGMSFKEGAVIYSVMMHRIKQAEPGVMSPKGPSTGAGSSGGLGGAGAKMQQAGQAGMQMAAGKGPGLQSALMAPASAAMQGVGRMMQGFGGRPGTASPSVPGAPGGLKRANLGLPPAAQMSGDPQGSIWPLLAALGVGGGAGALMGAGMQPRRPGRGAVQGGAAGMGAMGGGLAGVGLGAVGGAALGQSPLAVLGGAAAGGLGGAAMGGMAGNLMGQGVNNLTGGAPEDQQEEMAADSL